MDPIVHILKGKDPYQTARAVLQGFPLPDLEGRSVLIKPNAARLSSAGMGVTTHPLVVSATIDELRERGAAEIVIGESCIFGVNAQEAFRMTGMAEISERKGVPLIDFDRSEPMEIDVPGGSVIQKIKVPTLLKKFDFVISIPVMKTHMHTLVTLSIKNMKGLLWRREKARFHHLRCDERVTKGYKELDIAISEMALVLSPQLAIIDGTVGMEGMGPAYGRPKQMGIIVVGNNALSADAVAARLMGINPEAVPHLKLAAEKGIGEIDLQKILILPKDYMKWKASFAPPPSKLSIPFPDVIVHDRGSCSACLSTLLVFLQNYHSDLTDYRLEDEKVHIGIGKHLKNCPNGTILVGNCASRMKRKGIFVQGCPPVASQIMDTLKIRPRVSKK
jgi:uncharacterized protein (DUF362 family)